MHGPRCSCRSAQFLLRRKCASEPSNQQESSINHRGRSFCSPFSLRTGLICVRHVTGDAASVLGPTFQVGTLRDRIIGDAASVVRSRNHRIRSFCYVSSLLCRYGLASTRALTRGRSFCSLPSLQTGTLRTNQKRSFCSPFSRQHSTTCGRIPRRMAKSHHSEVISSSFASSPARVLGHAVEPRDPRIHGTTSTH